MTWGNFWTQCQSISIKYCKLNLLRVRSLPSIRHNLVFFPMKPRFQGHKIAKTSKHEFGLCPLNLIFQPLLQQMCKFPREKNTLGMNSITLVLFCFITFNFIPSQLIWFYSLQLYPILSDFQYTFVPVPNFHVIEFDLIETKIKGIPMSATRPSFPGFILQGVRLGSYI